MNSDPRRYLCAKQFDGITSCVLEFSVAQTEKGILKVVLDGEACSPWDIRTNSCGSTKPRKVHFQRHFDTECCVNERDFTLHWSE